MTTPTRNEFIKTMNTLSAAAIRMEEIRSTVDDPTWKGLMTQDEFDEARKRLKEVRDHADLLLTTWRLDLDPKKAVGWVTSQPSFPPVSLRVGDVAWNYGPNTQGDSTEPRWEGRRQKRNDSIRLFLTKRAGTVVLELVTEARLRDQTILDAVQPFVGVPSWIEYIGWSTGWRLHLLHPLPGREREWWTAIATMFPGCPLPWEWAHVRLPPSNRPQP